LPPTRIFRLPVWLAHRCKFFVNLIKMSTWKIFQFPLVRLRRLIAGKMFDPKTGRPWQEGWDEFIKSLTDFYSVQASLKRLAPGIIYLLLHMWGHAQWPSEYMYSQEFVVRGK
jgi:hypothetical protein